MTLRFVSMLMIFLTVISVVGSVSDASDKKADERFVQLAERFLSQYLELNPESATQLGDHRFDSRLDDYSREGFARRRDFNQKFLQELDGIPLNELSRANNVDYRILRSHLEGNLFNLNTMREYAWNPLEYNVGSSIYTLLARDFAPLKERLLSLKGRLEGIDSVCAHAKRNLDNPPRVYTETAITQNKGNISLIRVELQEFLNKAPEMKPLVEPAQSKALAALEDYGTWLEKDLLPRSNGDFRIGDEKFRQKLKYSLESDLTKEQILESALNDLRSIQAEMYDVALLLFKKYFPDQASGNQVSDRKLVIKAVLGKLAEQHPTNETIVGLAKDDVRQTTEFVRVHKLVSLPAEPVNVIVMPEYARGVAVAYCDAAGPLEKRGQTFFDISPTPKDWTPQRVESFFKEYNNHMVQDLTIHEAMPGHYLQLAHARSAHAAIEDAIKDDHQRYSRPKDPYR